MSRLLCGGVASRVLARMGTTAQARTIADLHARRQAVAAIADEAYAWLAERDDEAERLAQLGGEISRIRDMNDRELVAFCDRLDRLIAHINSQTAASSSSSTSGHQPQAEPAAAAASDTPAAAMASSPPAQTEPSLPDELWPDNYLDYATTAMGVLTMGGQGGEGARVKHKLDTPGLLQNLRRRINIIAEDVGEWSDATKLADRQAKKSEALDRAFYEICIALAVLRVNETGNPDYSADFARISSSGLLRLVVRGVNANCNQELGQEMAKTLKNIPE